MRLQRGLVLASAVLLLGGCGAGEGDGGQAASTVTVTAPAVTVTPPAETVTETVTVEPTPTETTSEPPRPTDEDDEDQTTEVETTATELSPESGDLGLDDFFNPDNEWEEGRWNVADRRDEKGVSVNLYGGSRDVELRLQNQFSTLMFDAGQANDSASSECTTKVDVVVDGELRETREFGFNTIQEFEGVDVRDSNAVRLEVSRTGCSDAVRVVLSGIKLE